MTSYGGQRRCHEMPGAATECLGAMQPTCNQATQRAVASRLLRPHPHRRRRAAPSLRLGSGLGLAHFPASKALIFSALIVLAVHGRPAALPLPRTCARLLGVLALVYYLEVIHVGAFHPYSWMPFVYFLVLLTALGFCPPAPPRNAWLTTALWLVAAAALLWACGTRLPPSAVHQLQGLPPGSR
jgi:hypothetical protein